MDRVHDRGIRREDSRDRSNTDSEGKGKPAGHRGNEEPLGRKGRADSCRGRIATTSSKGSQSGF